jgi:hypothetical protein
VRYDFQVPTTFGPYFVPSQALGTSHAILQGFRIEHTTLILGLGALVTAMERYVGAREVRQRMQATARFDGGELGRYFS